MNFANLNLLNLRLNKISGNMLPTNVDDSEFSLLWKMYQVSTWLMQLIFAIIMFIAIPYVPISNFVQNSVICLLMQWEISFVSSRIYLSKKLMLEYIQKFNDILAKEDEIMKNIVKKTLKPVVLPLKLYCVGGATTLSIWAFAPYLDAFNQKYFRYEDMRVPIAFSKQPFTVELYVIGETFVWIATLYIFLKKVAADVYLIHLAMLLTSQYQYLSVKLAMLFHKEEKSDEEHNEEYGEKHDGEQQKQHDLNADSSTTLDTKNKMITLCRHYNAVIYLASILKKVLALNFSVIYLNNIFRVSYLAFMIISAGIDGDYLAAYLLLVYLISSLTQLYILCYCSQQLLDMISFTAKLIIKFSRKITDKTFHEKWYLFGESQKRMLLFLMMGTKLDCDLAAFQNFALNLSSFMTILNQSYTITLLFLKYKMQQIENAKNNEN